MRRTRSLRRTFIRRGFTLIELLVVIAVILLLVALTVTVGTSLVQRSEVRETQSVLQLLDMAVYEWEQSMDRSVLYGVQNEPCNSGERYELIQLLEAGQSVSEQDGLALQTTDQLWAILSRSEAVRDILAQINPSFVFELTPDAENPPGMSYPSYLEGRRSYRILDAWGFPILAVLPGRSYSRQCDDTDYDIDPDSGKTSDIDGSIRTPFENFYGVAADRRIYFVSSGPSSRFGNQRLNVPEADLSDEQRRDVQRAGDNVYSYAVYTEQVRP